MAQKFPLSSSYDIWFNSKEIQNKRLKQSTQLSEIWKKKSLTVTASLQYNTSFRTIDMFKTSNSVSWMLLKMVYILKNVL